MVRVLTFQGVQVVQELLTNGTYLADHSLVREQRDYHKDVEQWNEH